MTKNVNSDYLIELPVTYNLHFSSTFKHLKLSKKRQSKNGNTGRHKDFTISLMMIFCIFFMRDDPTEGGWTMSYASLNSKLHSPSYYFVALLVSANVDLEDKTSPMECTKSN